MASPNIKQTAHHVVEQLPDNATWDDLLYEICVHQAIEAGIIESTTTPMPDGNESGVPLESTP